MKKAMFMTTVALGVSAFLLMAQDASRFNGTWKGEEGGQTRKLSLKNGTVYMEEIQPNGKQILRAYPYQGQEFTMDDSYGVWAGSKATGKLDGNKLVVDTTMPNGTKWHDEWTMAADGKSYSALRQLVAQGEGGIFGKGPAGGGKGPGGGGAPKAGGGGGKGPSGGGKGPGGPAMPEIFHKVE